MTPTKPAHVVVQGVKGVRLKQFERVVADILPCIQPSYVLLPAKPANGDLDVESWPFHTLPAAARVWGTLEGQLAQKERATRKEAQIRSMIRCVLALLPTTKTTLRDKEEENSASYTIVDFGGGSGHLAIPLALLLPSCRIVVVDLGQHSLELMHQKAELCQIEGNDSTRLPLSDDSIDGMRRCRAIPNLFSFHGPVESFNQPFDMALALHLCGEATDVALRKCVQAQAIVFAPCCVGKLNRERKNPYVWQATGANDPSIKYPQSNQFCQFLNEESDWNELAKAADYSNIAECRSSRNAARRTAKALLETDRRLFMEETFGFRTALTRMEPWEATPKNDIILGWRDSCSFKQTARDSECEADIQLTIDHLLIPMSEGNSSSKPHRLMNCVDWTSDEEEAIREQIQVYVDSKEHTFVFPVRLPRRIRKLVHYVADQMGLEHWSEGKVRADKTVSVGRKGCRKQLPSTPSTHPTRLETT